MSEFTTGEKPATTKWNQKTQTVKATAPGHSDAGRPWYDTTADKQKVRKANGLADKEILDTEKDFTVTGQTTFDRDPSAPFVVTAGSGVVANLDADKVDGKHASDFGGGNDIFGDGGDGDVTISSNTTLTETKFYNNLTVNASITLTSGGYMVFVKNTLTLNGKIDRKGNNGSGTSGGAGLSDGEVGGSYAGGNAAQNGSGGNGIGGNGGRGRDGSNNPNGTFGGTITVTKPIPYASLLFWLLLQNKTTYRGGAGGGGGNGSGGGGGSGGGITPVVARTISGNGIIDSEGGDAAGNQGGANNGGGDGGGGSTIVIYETLDAAATVRSRRGQSYLDNGAQDGRVIKLTTK